MTITMLIGNEVWNWIFFGHRSSVAGLRGMNAFALLLAILAIILAEYNLSVAAFLVPYIIWVGYDLLWMRGLTRLNPDAA